MAKARSSVAQCFVAHRGEEAYFEVKLPAAKREKVPAFGMLFRQSLAPHATTKYLSLELRIIAAFLQWRYGNGPLTSKMLAAATDASRAGVEKALRKLVAAELVLSIGGGELYQLSPLFYHSGSPQKWAQACVEIDADTPPKVNDPKPRGRRKTA